MDLPQSFYTVGWIVWGIVTVGGFAALEAPALADKDEGDTLTEHLRPIIRRHPILTAAFAGFLGWVGWHFIIQ